MSTRVQFRRGNTAQTAAFTGAVAEVTVNTDNNTLVVHDGTTSGGWQTPTLAFTQAAFNTANAAGTSAYVQSAFDKANSAASNTVITQGVDTTQNTWIAANQVYSQAAFGFANSVNTYAYSAYSTANSAQSNTINIQAVDTTQNTWIAANQVYSQAAFAFANSVNVYTQSAYNQANTANTKAQSGYDYANTVNTYAYSAYSFANTVNTYAYSAYSTANSAQANTISIQGVDATQNTWIAANQVYSQAAFSQANTANTKAQSGYDYANTVNTYAYSAYSTANSAQSNTINIQGVDATQNTWIAANQVYSQAAYSQANTANTKAQSGYDYANTVNTYAYSAYSQANTANTKAQSGYDFANTVNVYSQSAYSTANSAQSNTINIQGVDATQNTWIAANQVYSQAAFGFANSVNTYAYSAYAFANTVNAYAYSANTYLQSAISTANSSLKAYSDANFFTKSGGTISGAVTIQSDLSVTGNITFTGNATTQIITGNTGQFFGYASNGFNALYAGIPTGYLIEPQMITQFTSNYNGYAGVNHQNINSGANSSSDIFITPDNGTINDGFLDIGMGSSNYNYPGYGLIKPNDGYFIVYGNTTTGGGNLILSTGITNDIIFSANGVNDNNVLMRISGYGNNVVIKSTVNSISNTTGALTIAGGLGVKGNVYANAVYTNSLYYANGTPFSTGGGGNATGLSLTDGTQISDANTVFSTNTVNQTTDTFSATAYRSAQYLIQAISGDDVHLTNVLLTHNDVNIYLTEYGSTYSATLISINATLASGNVTLTMSPVIANTTIDFVRTAIIARTLPGGPSADLETYVTGNTDIGASSGSYDLSI